MMLCYTSGTTGNPKGVAYTQRSTYLHTISALANFPLGSGDNVLPVVPMFHASAWGYPWIATTVGAKLTYPGPDLTPAALVKLFETERVTFSAGVPTVWLGIQNYLAEHPEADTSSLRAFLCGGSAVPRSMIDWFWKNRGILVQQGWGMTETNPVASMAILKPGMKDWDFERQLDVLETAGLPVPGLEVKIVDENGDELPHDGVAFGELLIRGPWIAAEYYKDSRSSRDLPGRVDADRGCLQDHPRWIHPHHRPGQGRHQVGGRMDFIARPREPADGTSGGCRGDRCRAQAQKWQERPAAFVVLRPGATATEEELLSFLGDKVAKWWIPDRVVFIDAIPKTGTGKFDKKVVRDQYADLLMA